MKNGRGIGVVVGVLVAATLQCDGAEQREFCDADALQAALDTARPGATVRVGACRISGSFVVPAGVTLAGAGRGATVLVSAGQLTVLELTPGTPATRVTDLSVESAANTTILVRGDGEAAIERVDVRTIRGIAVAAEDVDALTMAEVSLTGPVTPETSAGWLDDPLVTATHGVVLVRVAAAELTDVTATGFALFGALLVDSTTTWRGGGAPRNVGTGLMVYRGAATLEDLDLSETRDGNRLMNAYGAVLAGDGTADVRVDSAGLTVSNGTDYGIFQEQVTAAHRDLVASGNGNAAVWAQNCPSLELTGAATLISGNAFAGVVGRETPRIVLDGGRIETTEKLARTIEEGRDERVGDGIHVARAGGTLEIRNVELAGNGRVGLLLDLRGGAMDGVTLEGITTSAAPDSDQLGAVAQRGTTPAGWDAGITRDPVTTANDALPRDALGVMPAALDGEIPAVQDVVDLGIVGIVEPDPPH